MPPWKYNCFHGVQYISFAALTWDARRAKDVFKLRDFCKVVGKVPWVLGNKDLFPKRLSFGLHTLTKGAHFCPPISCGSVIFFCVEQYIYHASLARDAIRTKNVIKMRDICKTVAKKYHKGWKSSIYCPTSFILATHPYQRGLIPVEVEFFMLRCTKN